jgi:hypothetical protein
VTAPREPAGADPPPPVPPTPGPATPAPAAAAEASFEPAGGAARPDTFELLTYLGSPIALGTVLFLYFGWVRSEAQARAFGADASVFEMTTQELVLRSVDVMFLIVFVLLGLALLAFGLDPVLRRRAGVFGRLLRHTWLLVPLGIALVVLAPTVGNVLLPSFVLLAIGGTAYGAALRRHARGERSPVRFGQLVVVVLLLIASLFWQTERVARVAGETLAEDLKLNLACRLPTATVLSTGRLHVEAADLRETRMAGQEDSTFRYRYDGFFLLQRSGDKYFLLTDGWNVDAGRLVLLPDSPAVRLEFGELPPPEWCGA